MKKTDKISITFTFTFPCEGVSEVSERVSAAEGASKASSPEQANE